MYPNPYGNNQYPPQNAPFGSKFPQSNPPFSSGYLQQPAPFGAFFRQPGANTPQQALQGFSFRRPTVVPAPNFDPSADCVVLRRAMKGFGTDEDAIINVLCHRTSHQRVQLINAFKTAYGRYLIDDIKSETSGNFQKVLLALLKPLPELYAFEINNASGNDALIEVMCMLTNSEIKVIESTYYRNFGRSMKEKLQGKSGHIHRLLTSLAVGARDESIKTDVKSAKADAQALKRAGVDRWGTDESEYHRVFSSRNYNQIRLIAQEYEKLAGKSLENDIKSEFSGDIEDGLLTILRTAINRPESFAIRLHKSMAGLGTDDGALIRLVVSRAEIDMEDIKEAFLRKYGITLKSFIKGDTSGDYRNTLFALIGEDRS